MSDPVIDCFRRNADELRPLPTEVSPVLRPMAHIRSVLFDVYGTLVVSGSGDIGLTASEQREAGWERVVTRFPALARLAAATVIPAWEATIHRHHQLARGQNIAYPEVDIVDVWRETLSSLPDGGSFDDPADLQLLATEFESCVNPVWPMPHARETIEQIHARGLLLGIVSNAQFFTLQLFPALLGTTLAELGFDADLMYFSYQHGQAKPGTPLYEMAAAEISNRHLAPHEVLYVGNDMLNDVMPAQQCGFQTALFAGDQRSLRWRTDDPRVEDVKPDLVVTSLDQVMACLTDNLD